MTGPSISLVIVEYNMSRELPRTLLSLSPRMQQGVEPDDYEIIVVDNGSIDRIPVEQLREASPNTHAHRIDQPSPSPAAAINYGLSQAKGDLIGVWIDGARLASPGIIVGAMCAARLHPRPVIATVNFHLGPERQRISIQHGYNEQVEDTLLQSISWPSDGYRLFDICALGGSASHGAFGPLSESNGLFMPRALWNELGGYDVRFRLPGGGLVNLDTFVRACELRDSQLIVLLGEGTFHQIHGGIATNSSISSWDTYHQEYMELRSKSFTAPSCQRWYYGPVSPNALKWIERSASTVGQMRASD